ncbi:MAG: GNAT family N-acetyltransferase [Paramuribaculum sp.]|nr:GNAT family N-acetyltransferase [Paramuribaculum sp.]
MENRYVFRAAVPEDVDKIMVIMEQAKALMLREGRRQWDDKYPNVEHIVDDVARGYGYVFADGDEIMVYGAVVYDGEPAYEGLDGEWLSVQPYVVVHRLAVSDAYKGHGLAAAFMSVVSEAASKRVRSFKVDTNFDNVYMLRVLDRLGFSYCGKIQYEGGERLAFEILL